MNDTQTYRLRNNVISLNKRPETVRLEAFQDPFIYGTDVKTQRSVKLNVITGEVMVVTAKNPSDEKSLYERIKQAPSVQADLGFLSEYDVTVRRQNSSPSMSADTPYLSDSQQLVLEKMASRQVSADELYKGLNQVVNLKGIKIILNYVFGWSITKDGEGITLSQFLELVD